MKFGEVKHNKNSLPNNGLAVVEIQKMKLLFL